jgi:hypothetical protein
MCNASRTPNNKQDLKMRKSILILIAFTISLSIQAQMNPKKIKSKVDYTHAATGFIFPIAIDQYNRADIYTFDKNKQNVGITYKTSDFKTIVSIYLYPAGAGTEDRLRNEYLKSMQSVANISENGVHAEQYAVSYKNGDYKINGFKANINDIDKKSSLNVFECGEWFFKIRITSEVLDTLGMKQTEQKILDLYEPTRLVKMSHLNPKADISFTKAAFVDSLMLGSAMGSAFMKLKWAMDNIDSLERASGFPGLYLDMHIASLKGFTEFEKKHPDFSKTKRTEEYLTELNSIIASGFLEEFIMEQFDMIMIVPDNLEFDFAGFDKWEIDNPISINLNERFYVIWFSE